MADHTGPSLSEALTQFVTAKKGGKKAQDGNLDLGRFVAWCGRERNVAELSPAEVAEYAQHIGLGGIDSAQRLNPVKTFLAFLKDEGWIQTGLAAHLRVPRSRRALASNRSATGTTADNSGPQLSQEGYDRLKAQLELLKEERVGVVEDIRRAMEDKDFRENAPLEAAKEHQGIIESRIRDLEDGLARAEVMVGKPVVREKKIVMGAKITLKDVASGKRVVYTLVDVREADVSSGKISTKSPVGEALLHHSVGEEVTINVPRGTLRYLIQGVGD
ncbi:MAG: GreA/GreB family elongation factor [Chloroflexi bacterium]|nr:GreA/GreB family elongation factor [Chloroflexota bacterium]